jgi:hypothetical protein
MLLSAGLPSCRPTRRVAEVDGNNCGAVGIIKLVGAACDDAHPTVVVRVDLREDVRADLDREHLDDTASVVVRRVAADAGVLREVRAAARVARRQVVTAEAAGVVVRRDLRGRAVGVETRELTDVRVEDTVLLAELAEVQVAPELVGEERILVEQVRGAGEQPESDGQRSAGRGKPSHAVDFNTTARPRQINRRTHSLET